MEKNNLVGCNEFREWLIEQGFRAAANGFASLNNECNWYAHRPSSLAARDCECNTDTRLQLVVYPHQTSDLLAPGGAWESAEIEVTGEAAGVWYQLKAYGLRLSDVRARLDDIEISLIAAWNALKTV
jgi:hypothetical protein